MKHSRREDGEHKTLVLPNIVSLLISRSEGSVSMRQVGRETAHRQCHIILLITGNEITKFQSPSLRPLNTQSNRDGAAASCAAGGVNAAAAGVSTAAPSSQCRYIKGHRQ